MVVVTLVFQMKTLTSFDEPLIELGLKPSSELLWQPGSLLWTTWVKPPLSYLLSERTGQDNF